ncbi:MAG: type II toxin-antitoxin system RelE/ParE family toxin [Propionibacteriaceae bacterium]|jgi:plasmid stabilization system protein ParE|nr:type II toxin-antitoxin system RelE/ParE family toxin [Propionibacteriaceae bacterium]
MTHSVVFTETASTQLEAIRHHIASASDPGVAESYLDSIIDHCLSLDTFPHRGVRRDDLRPGLRTVSYRKRVDIAFVVDDDASRVTILGVFYGGQDLDSAFPPSSRAPRPTPSSPSTRRSRGGGSIV